MSTRTCIGIGVTLGIAFSIWNFVVTWRDPLSDDTVAALVTFYGPMFTAWAVAAFVAARRTGRFVDGVRAGGSVAAATFVVFAAANLLRVNLFLDAIRQRADWQSMMGRFQASGGDSLRAFIAVEFIADMPLKIGVASLIGIAMGIVGATLAVVSRGAARRATIPCLLGTFAAAVPIPAAAQGSAAVQSKQLRVFTTRSIATVLDRIGPDFERRAGRRLNVTTDIAIRMVRRIEGGEPFDVLVAAPAQIDALIKAGKIVAATRTDLARSGIGVAVRAGAAKPDISSVDGFKRALLTAQSIAYLREGQSGVYMSGLLDRLGIADAIRSKLTLPDADIVSELVSRGEIELGIVVITQILTTPGVELAGPLPREIQSYITFTGGVSTQSSSIDAASELIRFLKSPEAGRVMREQGMEPGS